MDETSAAAARPSAVCVVLKRRKTDTTDTTARPCADNSKSEAGGSSGSGSGSDENEPAWLRDADTTTASLTLVTGQNAKPTGLGAHYGSRRTLAPTLPQLLRSPNTTRAPLSSSSPPSSPPTPAPRSRSPKTVERKPLVQLHLDFGQKPLAHVVCSDCGLLYMKARPEDEQVHAKYHRAKLAGIILSKQTIDQCVEIETAPDRIVRMLSEKHGKEVQKQMKDILRLINAELGAAPQADPHISGYRMFVLTDRKAQVVGCVVAESLSQAFRSPSGALAAPEQMTQQPCKVGVNRMWVKEDHRHRGIASRLLDAMRGNMIFSQVVHKDEVAFSQPTQAGQLLAEHYCGRTDILVYHGER